MSADWTPAALVHASKLYIVPILQCSQHAKMTVITDSFPVSGAPQSGRCSQVDRGSSGTASRRVCAPVQPKDVERFVRGANRAYLVPEFSVLRFSCVNVDGALIQSATGVQSPHHH